jgi:hypothetical protein
LQLIGERGAALAWRRVAVTIALAFLLGWPAYSDTISDPAVNFEFEANGTDPRVCHLTALIMNVPRSPEAAKLSLTYAESKSQNVAFVGFALDVGDTQFANGLPAGITPAKLSSAEISAPEFTTTGRLFGGPIPDGGIMMSTQDPETARLLMGIFFEGSFRVTFARQGSAANRTYVVRNAPDPNVVQQFLRCAKNSLPR